jgi:flagellin
MTVINSNSAALRAQNGSRLANNALNTAMARLSSGKKINSASDDAAGLAISDSMTSQINGMNQAISNANDGISLAQTADGTLSEVNNNLQRIRELAVQSASGTYSDSDRANMQAEVTQLTSQISTSLSGATFNGVPLFTTTADGKGTTTAIQVGTNSTDKVNISIANIDLSALTGTSRVATAADVTAGATRAATAADVGSAGDVRSPTTAEVGQSYTATAADVTAGATHAATQAEVDADSSGNTKLGDQVADVEGQTYTTTADDKLATQVGDQIPAKVGDTITTPAASVSTVDGANSVMDTMDTLMSQVDNVRAGIGASESRLNSVVNNLTNNVTNLTDANSQIDDADFSVETTNLAKAQILSQAATAMLAQANQSQQGVLKLLQ